MDDLHPLVRAILRGLLESPLYTLADDAVARLASDRGDQPRDQGAGDIPQRREGLVSRPGSQPTDSDGIGQLNVVEEVVGDWLAREIAIAHAMPKLAKSLNLKTVAFDRMNDVNLANDVRVAALEVFEERFKVAASRARAALAGDAGELR